MEELWYPGKVFAEVLLCFLRCRICGWGGTEWQDVDTVAGWNCRTENAFRKEKTRTGRQKGVISFAIRLEAIAIRNCKAVTSVVVYPQHTGSRLVHADENRAVARSFTCFHGSGADPGGSINIPREKKKDPGK